MKKVISLIVLLTLSILVASAPAAQNTGSGSSPGARISISADELLDANFVPPKPTYNLSFMPAAGEESAIQQFQGELEVTAIALRWSFSPITALWFPFSGKSSIQNQI